MVTIIYSISCREIVYWLENITFQLIPKWTHPPNPLSALQRGGVMHCILINSPSLRSREGENKGVSTLRE
jgi:hypothetical protein